MNTLSPKPVLLAAAATLIVLQSHAQAPDVRAPVGNRASADSELQSLQWEPLDYCWRSGRLCREVETRFGLVSINYDTRDGDFDGNVEVRLNGSVVFRQPRSSSDYGLMSLKQVFALGTADVAILGATSGGSGSPPELLHVLVVAAAKEPMVLVKPDFRSVDGTELVATDGSRLFFDLGYQAHLRKTATFDGSDLELHYAAAVPTPLPERHCENLYDVVAKSCTWAKNAGYPPGTVRELARSGNFSTATMHLLNTVRQHPGFQPDEYSRACMTAAETGDAPGYEDFKSNVCTPR
jgi:hypothetical protein